LRGTADEPLAARTLKVEQRNSSVAYGDRLLMKLFRRLDEGVNPDLELGAFLTDSVGFPHIPPVAGSIEYRRPDGSTGTVAILHGFVRNEGDAWSYTLAAVHRFFERVMTSARTRAPSDQELPRQGLIGLVDPAMPPGAAELCDSCLESASLLGQRTAELHLALASSAEDPALAPEPFSELYQRSLYQGMRGLARRTFRLLRGRLGQLPDELREDAKLLLVVEQEVVEYFRRVVGRKLSGSRIRCHGDYHLGQVLFTGKDFMIIDLEGDPQRRISERRIKRSPLRDVAGMIRSFDYASQSVLFHQISGIASRDEMPILQQWARFWSLWTSVCFLRAYLRSVGGAPFIPRSREEIQLLLDVYLLERAVYELGDELVRRPSWARVPIHAVLRILETRE